MLAGSVVLNEKFSLQEHPSSYIFITLSSSAEVRPGHNTFRCLHYPILVNGEESVLEPSLHPAAKKHLCHLST